MKKKVCNNFSAGPRSRIANAKRVFSKVTRRLGVAGLRETRGPPCVISRGSVSWLAPPREGAFRDGPIRTLPGAPTPTLSPAHEGQRDLSKVGTLITGEP